MDMSKSTQMGISEYLNAGGLEHEFYDFPYIGNNHPNWLSYFSRWLKPPTSLTIPYSIYLRMIIVKWWGFIIPNGAATKDLRHGKCRCKRLGRSNNYCVWTLEEAEEVFILYNYAYINMYCTLYIWLYICNIIYVILYIYIIHTIYIYFKKHYTYLLYIHYTLYIYI